MYFFQDVNINLIILFMNKWLFLLCISLLLFCRCSDDLKESSILNEHVEEGDLSRAGGDQIYDFLGYGYDVTGEFFTEKSTKFAVIDLVALQKDHPNRLVVNTSKNVEGKVIGGEYAESYTKELAIQTKTSVGFGLFGGSIKSVFNQTIDYSSKYSMASYNWKIQHKRVALNADADLLQNYLTREFREDLESKNASYIISRYGTHVLTNIVLGGRLEIIYRSSTLNENRKSTVSAGVTASFAKIFNVKASVDYDMNLALQNSEQKMTYRVIGGLPETCPPATLDLTPGVYPTIDISTWVNSCTSERMDFIDAEPGSLIPIYKFVKDPVKRAEVESAYNKYISENGLLMPHIGTPLYRYWHDVRGDHFYCREGSGQSAQGYNFERIECYIYTYQAKGTVPLYRYYNGVDHYYTTDWLGSGSAIVDNHEYGYERIECYVYPNQVEGTVPIYRYYNGRDHFYTREWSGENCQWYNHERIAFYAYPGEAYGIYF